MQVLRKYLYMAIPAFIMLALVMLEPLITGLGNFAIMARLLVLFECLSYYLVVGFSKLYNPDVDFDGGQEYDRIVGSIILGIHILVGVLVLGVYFAV